MSAPDETPLEQRMRLGHELTEALAEMAMAHLECGWPPVDFEVVPEEDGTPNVYAGDLAYRHVETGLVWTVAVEVTCTPVERAT